MLKSIICKFGKENSFYVNPAIIRPDPFMNKGRDSTYYNCDFINFKNFGPFASFIHLGVWRTGRMWIHTT